PCRRAVEDIARGVCRLSIDDPQLLSIGPAPPSAGLNDLKPFNFSTVLMAVHKDCYTSLNLTQQGVLRRRETVGSACVQELQSLPGARAELPPFCSNCALSFPLAKRPRRPSTLRTG